MLLLLTTTTSDGSIKRLPHEVLLLMSEGRLMMLGRDSAELVVRVVGCSAVALVLAIALVVVIEVMALEVLGVYRIFRPQVIILLLMLLDRELLMRIEETRASEASLLSWAVLISLRMRSSLGHAHQLILVRSFPYC
jgi:hypothetical protein